MKKKILLVLIITFIFIFICKISLSGLKKYSHNIDGILYVPKLSIFNEYKQCNDFYLLNYDDKHKRLDNSEKKCVNKISFTTIQSKKKIIKEFNKFYEEQLCNNDKLFYYDSKNNVTILAYSVDKSGIFSTINIDYINDKINIDDCNVVYTNIEYKYESSDKNNSSKLYDYKYYDKDGKYYSIYSDCVDCLMVKNGTGSFLTLREMLIYEYIDMNSILNSLENKSESGYFIKEIYNDGTLYKSDIFDLYKCNNKNIIIGNKINYKENICETLVN